MLASPLSEIQAVIRGLLPEAEVVVGPETRFDDIETWEPMDLVSLVVELECRFDVLFELAEIDRVGTVADLVAMIEAKQSLAAA